MKYIFKFVIFSLIGLSAYPQPISDAVFEKIEKTYTLNDDGSMEFRSFIKLKLLTHHAFNRLYGETFIVYNPLHQQLKINLAQVTQKSGKVVKAPENAFNEVLPQFATDAPYYNHLREMVVTHAGLELDAVIELDYTIRSDSGYYAALMGSEVISDDSPITEETISIRVPSWKNLYYKVLNTRTAPVVTKTKGYNEYRFTFLAIRENSHEPNQPQDNGHSPQLLFSTFSAAAGQHFFAQQDALNYKTDQGMKAAVAKAKTEATNDMQLVLKIQDMVVNRVNTYPIPQEFTGYTARSPIETWNSNGGTPFEKCLLLTALYREAKINAEPMAIIPTSVYNDTIGILSQVTEFLVQVNPRELEQMILSPVNANEQNLFFALGGKTSMLLNIDKPHIQSFREKFENKVVMNGSFNLNDSMNYIGKISLILSERVNPTYKIKRDSSIVKQFIGGGISAKDIKTFKTDRVSQMQSELVYDIGKKQALKNQANYYFLDIPFCKRGSDQWHINYLTAGRSTPFEIPFPVDEYYSFTFSVPDSIKLVNFLDLTEMKTSFGELSLLISRDRNKIIVKRSLRIYKQTIPSTDYAAFKQMLDLWNDSKYRKLVLKK